MTQRPERAMVMQSRPTQPFFDPTGCGAGEAGESGWFDAIYRRYRADLVRYAERRGAEDAEGVADLALLDLARAASRLRSRDEPVVRAYLYKAARNRASRSRSKPTDDIDGIGDIEDPSTTSFDEMVAVGLDLDQMLAELSPPQEAALRLRFFQHMTSAEAADVMEVDASTVRTHQRRGLTRLRQLTLAAAVAVAAVVVVATLRSGDDQIRIDGPVAPGENSTTISQTTTVPGERSVDTTVAGAPAADRSDAGQPTTSATVDTTTSDEARTATPSTTAIGSTSTLSTTAAPAASTTLAPSTTTTAPTTSSSTSTTQVTSTTLPPNQATFLDIFDGNRILFSSFLPERDCLTQSGAGLILDPVTCRTDLHTMWWVTTTDNRASYTIANLQQTSCWTVDGIDVIVSDCVDTTSQRWIIDHTAAYRIRSAQNGRCLEVRGGYTDPTIGVADCLAQDNAHQLWGMYGHPI